jgi:ADP-ribose pyrophosphatase YjhB (NUDIX family)
MLPQKYKIYVNATPFFLITKEEFDKNPILQSKTVFVSPYLGKKKQIRQYLDLIGKNKDVKSVTIVTHDLPKLWNDFQECFKIIEAAGGYVLNAKKELLVFYRRDSWDMPKGKIDEGETPEVAAVREVQEETGLINVTLGEFLIHTYHTYEHKEKIILKKTWWYIMHTNDMNVTPQTEEDIEKIEWVEPKSWVLSKPVVYQSILDVILSYPF